MTTSATHNRTSILSIVQTILEEGRALELTPRDIALLVLMRQEIESGDEAALAIPYSTIQALHSRLDTIEAGGSQNPERRLTESLARLVKAECIAKADMTRIRMTADSEYQVTSIGDSVAEWHVMQSEFSGEPLTAIFRAFISQLMRISEDAEKAETENDWHFDVVQQMQHTIKGMLVSIQRHQKELDRQHAALRDFVPTLLIQGSEESIAQCESQLSKVIKTIDDLQEVVLASTSRAQSLIDQIGDLARPSAPKGVENICDEFQRRLLNIAQWTTQRASDWVEHHNVVHNYLRTVVRIDRQRRITDALKRTIASVPGWTLEVAAEPYFLRMREDVLRDSTPKKSPRVPKEATNRVREFEEATPDNLQDILLKYLKEDLANGGAYASSVMARAAIEAQDELDVLPHFPWLIGAMANGGQIDYDVRNWTKATHHIEIEELKVTR
jgi:chromosome partition protein MukF